MDSMDSENTAPPGKRGGMMTRNRAKAGELKPVNAKPAAQKPVTKEVPARKALGDISNASAIPADKKPNKVEKKPVEKKPELRKPAKIEKVEQKALTSVAAAKPNKRKSVEAGPALAAGGVESRKKAKIHEAVEAANLPTLSQESSLPVSAATPSDSEIEILNSLPLIVAEQEVKTSVLQISDLVAQMDKCDMNDHYSISEFSEDIYQRLRAEEHLTRPDPDYMSRQTEIAARMREKLIDWIIEVHNKFQLEPETLHLSCNVLDRFLTQTNVLKAKLQLVGCVALMVSSKYEEIYPPVGHDFVYISANAFAREELFQMETTVLNTLKFDLTVPSSLHFSRRFLKVAGGELSQNVAAATRVNHHTSYLLESSLQYYQMLKFPSSLVAVCAAYIALRCAHFADEKVRPPAEMLQILIEYSGYSKVDMLPCLTEFRDILCTEPRYGAVRRKFSGPRWASCSIASLV